MENLPIDAIEVLSRFLNEQEISRCSSVSRTWRGIFNDDIIWRRICSRRPQLEEHLRTTPGELQPLPAPAEPSDSTIGPMGKWRQAKIRENHLWNNIQKGEFTEKRIEHDEEKGFPLAQGFLSDDLVYLMFEKSIEVWDVRVDPTVLVQHYGHAFRNSVSSFQIFGHERNMAIIVDGFIVHRIQINCQTGHLQTLRWFKFDMGENASACLGVPKYFVSGSTLVGVNRGHSSTVHVWDLPSGERTGEISFQMAGCRVVDIFGSQSTSNFVVVFAPEKQKLIIENDCPITAQWLHQPSQYAYSVYCLKGMHFFEFKYGSCATNGYSCAVLNDFVGILDKRRLVIINYKTQEVLHTGAGGFRTFAVRDMVMAVGDYFLMFSSTSDNVEVFNPKSRLHYVNNTDSEFKFTPVYMVPSVCEIKEMEELRHFRKSCFFMSGKGSFQITNQDIRKIGIVNCVGMNPSGTRYLTTKNYSNWLGELYRALEQANSGPLAPFNLTLRKKKLVVVRQLW